MTTPIDKKFLENPELVERLAAIEHERWSVWMRHLFSKCGISHFRNGVESLEIPAWAGEQWKRQMNTPYADLTEAEKESDRVEVRKTLACLASQPKPTDNHIKRAHELFGAVMHHTVEEELWRIIQAIEDASPKPTTEELRRIESILLNHGFDAMQYPQLVKDLAEASSVKVSREEVNEVSQIIDSAIRYSMGDTWKGLSHRAATDAIIKLLKDSR